MGKNFCKIEGKWCKFCQHKKCIWTGEKIDLVEIHRCPKRESTRTVRLKDYIKDADFFAVMSAMYKWHPDQEENISGYLEAWERLQEIDAIKTDWFISVELVHEDEYDGSFGHIDAYDWICVEGIDERGKIWSIEFEPWKHWLGMNIKQDSLDKFSKEDILAAILYEMTFNGYSENEVDKRREQINESFKWFENNKDLGLSD